MMAAMKIKAHDRSNRATIVKISPGRYEIIGASAEEFAAAKQWAAFWGHQIAPRPKCRRSPVPAAFRFSRAFRFMCLKSRAKF